MQNLKRLKIKKFLLVF
ncbi:UNVERIFIED_CONTAM: hypothetical protein GTU68_067177 [Idotea baltica]|nr:hypothetical protein [Idotea baltica]